MHKIKQLLLIVFILSSLTTFSRDKDSTFLKLKGKVYGKIFTNFHSQINSGNNATAFQIRRAYFGYKSQLSKYFDAHIKLDIGSPEDISEFSLIRRYAYFKNAYVRYKRNKLTTYFGIIDILHFKMQEGYWAHRYIDKSFADRYRFGFKADLGWQIIYDWAKWLSTDFTIMNGEGYTKLQNDNTLKGGLGISFFPYKNFVVRVYGDLSVKGVAQSTLAGFIGYKLKKKVIAGVEYNYRFNSDFQENYDRFGYSIYGSYYLRKNIQLFARYDKVNSNNFVNEENPWNLAKDGSAIIAGIEYSPIKYLKLALNYQDWVPWAENINDVQFIFLNIKISF